MSDLCQCGHAAEWHSDRCCVISCHCLRFVTDGPVAPTPACRCAELAKALEEADRIIKKAATAINSAKNPWRAANVLSVWTLADIDPSAILAAHDAAKDAEIARLREALGKANSIAARQLAEPIEGKADTGAFFDICTVIDAALEGGKA